MVHMILPVLYGSYQARVIWSISFDINDLRDPNREPIEVVQLFAKYFPIDHFQDTAVCKLKVCFILKSLIGKSPSFNEFWPPLKPPK